MPTRWRQIEYLPELARIASAISEQNRDRFLAFRRRVLVAPTPRIRPRRARSCRWRPTHMVLFRRSYIARSLDALFEQAGIEGVEVIIADSSTDGTGSIAKRTATPRTCLRSGSI
jgi:hypothetical protein